MIQRCLDALQKGGRCVSVLKPPVYFLSKRRGGSGHSPSADVTLDIDGSEVSSVISSNVTSAQVAEAQGIAPVVCVQNHYNLLHRHDDPLIDELGRNRIAYVPFFPLGGFTPLESLTLSTVAQRRGATPMQVALAWLLARAPNILLIPGTSSPKHLRENLAAAELSLTKDTLFEMEKIGRTLT
jgi:aryl-alcohol dehydrogenase-like predicted oxidoreductase